MTTDKLVRIKRAPSQALTLATVPDKEIYDRYVSRKIHGVPDMDVADYALRNRMNMMLTGPTGSGKTHYARAFAAYKGMRFYAIPNNVGIEPSQLFGKWLPNGKGGWRWQDGPVTDMVRHGGVLLNNEGNMALPRVSSVLFPLLDERRHIMVLDNRGEVVPGHPNLLVMMDLNDGYVGTSALNQAFRNRFAIQVSWSYEHEIEEQLVRSASLLKLVETMRSGITDDKGNVIVEVSTDIGTNAMIEFERIAMGELGLDFAIGTFAERFADDEKKGVLDAFNAVKSLLADDYADMTPGGDFGNEFDEEVSGWMDENI